MTGPNPQVDAREMVEAFHKFVRATWSELDQDRLAFVQSGFIAGWDAAIAASDAETSARVADLENALLALLDAAQMFGLGGVAVDGALRTLHRALLTEEKQDR